MIKTENINIVGEMEINCSTEGHTDCDLDCCLEMKSMLVHAGTCRASKCCSVTGCSEVTFLLGHWTTCSDWSCYLCRRVWEPKKDAEYETKCRDFNRVTAVAAAILDMSSIDPTTASPVIQELVIDTFDEIEYSDYACELEDMMSGNTQSKEQFYYNLSMYVLSALDYLEESWQDLSEQPISFWKELACDKLSYKAVNNCPIFS